MIRYTLLEAPSDVRLRLRPFFARDDNHTPEEIEEAVKVSRA